MSDIENKLNLKVDDELLEKIRFMQDKDGDSLSETVRESINLRYVLIKFDLLRKVTAMILRFIK